MSSTADRLHRARLNSGYTTDKASDLSGIPALEIARYEADEANPDPLTLRRLGVLYGCSVEFLAGNPGLGSRNQGVSS